MGFLQAVYSLGQMTSEAYKDSPLADIMNFLQLPYPLSKKENDTVYAIRVWLDAVDNNAEVLDIKGIARIDRIEYQAISDEEIEEVKEVKIKERCLYRDPVGSNVSWRFTPLYKLGKGSKDLHKKLLGESGNWKTEKDSRFYKLYHNLLYDYERSGYLTKGSTNRIMASLVARIDKITEFCSDRKIPSFLIFGLKVDNKFVYPGEVTAFINYFKEKLNPNVSDNTDKDKKTGQITYCSLCAETGKKLETLDKVFKFATFDKPGFLPGTKKTTGIEEKVFPVCETCYEILSAGKEEMEKRFVNFNNIPNISLYVIPEIISDKKEYFRKASDHTKDFLKNGVRYETQLFRNLSKHNEGLVFHFLFAETNQAQIIIHSLVEDVPPTRLRKLQDLWKETCLAFSYDFDASDKKCSLDTAISQIVAVLLSIAGKREQDKEVMKDKIISVISGLLNGEAIGIKEIKTLIVSRLAGLFIDPDWLNPSEKGQLPGRQKIKGMAEVIDFLHRVNRR